MRHVFPCGTPALDFVGTLQARRGQTPDERIGTPGRLDTWFVQSGLLDKEPGSDAADPRAALDLREAIYSLAQARIDDRPLPAGAVTAVNRQATGAPVAACLRPGGARRLGTASQALTDLAREAVEVFAGEEWPRGSRAPPSQSYDRFRHGARRANRAAVSGIAADGHRRWTADSRKRRDGGSVHVCRVR
ncbi:ABATE domain-containing protein [Streptomyces sp. NPDC059460]|uniref:ABATE domain-containing protein n=1 Tax=Streptomyces sp. NPDC059460 TaxID=3346840 RepID=UPI003688B9A8